MSKQKKLEMFEENPHNLDVNPKLEGSNLVDCVPQTGTCPMGCLECFYNSRDWYRDRNIPQIPTLDEAKGKVVRVNSGNDSNIDRENVIKVASRYDDFFFNTSVPMFEFPGPIVFTVNGRGDDKSFLVSKKECKKFMFVRFRLNLWNLDEADKVVAHYTALGTPVVMTFMRYSDKKNIQPAHLRSYKWEKHILSEYYMLKKKKVVEVMGRWKENPLVKKCGSLESDFCRDCGNCYNLYFEWKKKQK